MRRGARFREEMSLQEIMELFYQAEQNIEISCLWDDGWRVRIGDVCNGYKDEAYFDSLNGIIEFLRKWYSNYLAMAGANDFIS